MSEAVQTGVVQTSQEQPKAPVEGVAQETQNQKAPDDLSAKFAALAKKERIAHQQAKKVKQLEAQLAERERQIAEREREWNEEFKRSPLEAIKKRGYSYEDLTKAALNDGRFQPETELKEVKSEIQRLREETLEKEKRAQEQQRLAQQQAEQEALEAFKDNISEHITANKEKYELTSLYDGHDLVLDTIEKHWEKTLQETGRGKVLSIDEACQLVEEYYEGLIERTAKSSKKFQSKYQMLKEMAAASDKKEAPRTSKTLTNDLVPSSAMPSILPAKTEEERMKRALAALG